MQLMCFSSPLPCVGALLGSRGGSPKTWWKGNCCKVPVEVARAEPVHSLLRSLYAV